MNHNHTNGWMRTSQVLLSITLAILLFLAGTWVGKSYSQFSWEIWFASILAILLVGSLIWSLGYASKTLEEEEPDYLDFYDPAADSPAKRIPFDYDKVNSSPSINEEEAEAAKE